jgi:hypothetical protein
LSHAIPGIDSLLKFIWVVLSENHPSMTKITITIFLVSGSLK